MDHPKQLGVSLPNAVREKLEEVAKKKRQTMSGMAAEAITWYLFEYLAGNARTQKSSIFKKVKNEFVRKAQESA